MQRKPYESPTLRRLTAHEAINDLWQEAERGNSAALYMLGVTFQNGLCVPKDPSQAAYWFRRAAETLLKQPPAARDIEELATGA